jgi:hypothetical protein
MFASPSLKLVTPAQAGVHLALMDDEEEGS